MSHSSLRSETPHEVGDADARRELLGRLVDDAGLFPPARRTLADALAVHERTLASDAAWMVGRFVVPASRFAELAQARATNDDVLSVTVVIDAPAFDEAALSALAHAGQSQDRVRLEALEVPLARVAIGSSDDDRLQSLERQLRNAQFPSLQFVYVELPQAPEASAAALRALHRTRERGSTLCAKVRLGGLEAAAVPAATDVAQLLWEAARLRVPFKATAGLHHPVRCDDAALGTQVHGFLNVFGGAALVWARGLDRATLAELVADRCADNFSLDERRFMWRGIGCDAHELHQARSEFAHAFGSCSLDEPVAGLRELAMFPAAAR